MDVVAVDETDPRYPGWRTVWASGVGVFFASISFFTFSVFLKPLIAEFGWSREAVSVAYGCLTLSAAASSPLLGVLLDRVGLRRVAIPCLVLLGVALASLAALRGERAHLYTSYALLGVAITGTSVAAYARAICAWFDRRRGVAFATAVSFGAVGAMLGPPMVQATILRSSWRTAYLGLGLLVLALGLPVVARFARERAGRVAESEEGNHVSVRSALGTRTFWMLVLIVLGSTVSVSGVLVHLSAMLTDRGLGAGEAAIVISAFGTASLAGRLTTGWLLDRFQGTRIGFALLAIAALGLALLGGAHSFAAGAVAAILIGYGTGGELDVVPYLLSRYFGLRSMATLFGLVWATWGVASAIGPVLMGRVYDATGSYERLLMQFGLVTLIAAAVTLTLPKYRFDDAAEEEQAKG